MLDEWIRNISGEDNKSAGWRQKGRYILVILIALGLLALIWSPNKEKSSAPQILETSQDIKAAQNFKEQMSVELESILSQIEGAGRVKVSVSLTSDGIKTYATNTRNEERETQESDRGGTQKRSSETNLEQSLAVTSGSPLLIENKAPEILGVLVVADGARDPAVCEKLTNAATALLNISPHKVRVMPREGGLR